MALSGNFTIFNPHPTDTEIVSHSVTYPSNLPEDSEFYSLRGTTAIVSESVSVRVPTTFSNQYVILKNTSINKFPDKFMANYEWEGYNSQEDSRDLSISPNFSGEGMFNWDWGMYTNMHEEAYLHLSSSFISSSITNV